jgi:hypothetical protein
MRSTICLLAAGMCFLAIAAANSCQLPGIAVSSEEASQIHGGICRHITKSCELVNNSCAIGQCLVDTNFGARGQTTNQVSIVCLNGDDGSQCCAPAKTTCPPP